MPAQVWLSSYNDQGQTLSEEITIPTPNGDLTRQLARTYAPYGRPTGYQLKHGDTTEQTVIYAYDAMGRMSGVTADGKEFTYTYMPNTSQLLSQVTSPVHTVENTWEPTRDTLAVKTNKWKNKANTPVISAYAYTVNNLGQRTSVTTSGEVYATAPADRVWQYDTLGQVISANDNHYIYDQIGNRITIQEGTEQSRIYTANALNQYAAIGNITPTYDADGNQLTGLQSTVFHPERNQLSFAYNAQNRPIQVKQNDTIRENYTYDHQGRRIQKGNTVTLYDSYNAIAEYDLNTRKLKTIYAWGMDMSGTLQEAGGVGGLLSITDFTTQTVSRAYPTYDGNGNITEYLTEENSGFVAAHYEYDAFGNIVKKTGEKEYGYQFSTKPYNDITGQLYYNYRDYDSVVGRWISRDLIEEYGGLNLHIYVNNNPMNICDILGLKLTIYRPQFSPGTIDKNNPGRLGETKPDVKDRYGLVINEDEDKCCATITQSREVDVIVESKRPSDIPSGFTREGMNFIVEHEERRIRTYVYGYYAYYDGEKDVLVGKQICCKNKGKAKSSLGSYYKKVVTNRDKMFIKYVTFENAVISDEMELYQLRYDKNGNIIGGKFVHEVNTPDSPVSYELKCD